MVPKPNGERDRGWVADGKGETIGGEMCVDCVSEGGMDMERSEVGVLSSTAEAEGCCWFAWRVLIWVCWERIMLSRRFYRRQYKILVRQNSTKSSSLLSTLP